VITKLLALCLATGSFLATAAEIPASVGFESSVRSNDGVLELRYQGRRILVYAFATNQFKPYVRELYTLAGDNVLLDSPPDHAHHHGLMYAIRVNGVNFWEEREAPGWERPVQLLGPQISRSSDGLPQASFTQFIHWVADPDRAVADSASIALMVERRTLTVTVNEKTSEVALGWHADFELGRSVSKVTLAGANYHGLGLRLPPPFNKVAQHENSERTPYSNPGGQVTPARWSSVSHTLGEHDVTLAIFGRPSAGRGLPFFFTMVQPFTYLSVTQGLDKTTVDYAQGEKFSLEYLLVVYAGRKNGEFLDQRYQRWAH
jgi:hypothetical protein